MKPPQPSGPGEKNNADATSSLIPSPPSRRAKILAGIFLVALVLGVFGQAAGFEFINYDDPDYICDNPAINRGLNWPAVVWVCTHSTCGAWFPLTDVSHQLCWEFFGAKAGGHHCVNVLLHAATVVVLFLALLRLAGLFWPAVFTAALFAVHPLRVESVAWVVERKDVLSGWFFALTLWAWAGHAKKRGRLDDSSLVAGLRRLTPEYFLALVFFTLGLLSKSMLVTLPGVLLLLDWWPLQRLPGKTAGTFNRRSRFRAGLGLVVEKIPFIALSAVICIITLATQKNAVVIAQHYSPVWRVGNAIQACADYVMHTVRPVGLAVSYPASETAMTPVRLATAIIILLLISAVALLGRRKQPWLAVGWLWFLGMLLPVIDIMQAGHNARADRYTYLPQIGLCLLVAWAAWQAGAGSRIRRGWWFFAGLTLVAALAVAAFRQTAHWRDSVTVWSHAVAGSPENAFAQNNLGSALARQGKWEEALPHFQRALESDPGMFEALINLGLAKVNQDKYAEAIDYFQRALRQNPYSSEASYNLGTALDHEGRPVEAVQALERALQFRPGFAKAHYALGVLLAGQGRWEEAIPHYAAAFHFKVEPAEARYVTATAQATENNWPAAAEFYQQAIQLKPDYAEAHFNLGKAFIRMGKITEAHQSFDKALALASAQGDAALAESIRSEIKSSPP